MTKLIENQIDENQVIENELEEISGGCNCSSNSSWMIFADEDDQQNVIF